MRVSPVKFQHIGKSQIVDSDIDSLDSVGYMSNLNVQNVLHVFDQYGDREWNFFCSLVVYAFCPLEWNLFCLEGSKYCYLGYMSNLKTCKTFCTFFDLTNIGIGNGISVVPIRNLTLPWTNSIGSYEIWICPSPFVSKMAHMRVQLLNFNILENPVLWTQTLILWIALWV